jgi:MerR family transcriptional regulator/heat shock protein HspR
MSGPYEMQDDLPVYVISVAAQLSGMHPQTLRAYDRLGLVSPGRREGKGHRRYSMRDILALREIQRLSREGVNLSGIKLIFDQLQELEQARRLIAELHAEIAQLRVELESTRAVAARLAELRRDARGAGSGAPGQPGLVPVRSTRVAAFLADQPRRSPGSSQGE